MSRRGEEGSRGELINKSTEFVKTKNNQMLRSFPEATPQVHVLDGSMQSEIDYDP